MNPVDLVLQGVEMALESAYKSKLPYEEMPHCIEIIQALRAELTGDPTKDSLTVIRLAKMLADASKAN